MFTLYRHSMEQYIQHDEGNMSGTTTGMNRFCRIFFIRMHLIDFYHGMSNPVKAHKRHCKWLSTRCKHQRFRFSQVASSNILSPLQ